MAPAAAVVGLINMSVSNDPEGSARFGCVWISACRDRIVGDDCEGEA